MKTPKAGRSEYGTIQKTLLRKGMLFDFRNQNQGARLQGLPPSEDWQNMGIHLHIILNNTPI